MVQAKPDDERMKWGLQAFLFITVCVSRVYFSRQQLTRQTSSLFSRSKRPLVPPAGYSPACRRSVAES